jgi:hypothetical protein
LIPWTKTVQTTQNYDNSNLNFQLYFDENVTSSERQFYFDEGNNSSENNPELLTCETEISKEKLLISMESNLSKSGSFLIYHIKNKPKSVKINDKKIKFIYNKEYDILLFDYTHNSNKTNIKIKL